MYAASVLKSMLGQATTGVIPQELMTTHRIMQRWAVANGCGLPTERWDDSRVSRVPPLDDYTALLVDQIFLKCPPRTKRIVDLWYTKPWPTSEISRMLGMSPRSLEKGVNVALNFLKWKFEQTNNKALLKLLRVQV
jgi:hypothetical protein